MNKVLASSIPLATAFALLAACASSTSANHDGAAYLVYQPDEAGVGDAALLVGRVDDSDGCLTVTENDSDLTFTPIFPATWPSEDLTPGKKIEVRGSAYDSLPDVQDLQVPDECQSAGPFWLVISDE